MSSIQLSLPVYCATTVVCGVGILAGLLLAAMAVCRIAGALRRPRVRSWEEATAELRREIGRV